MINKYPPPRIASRHRARGLARPGGPPQGPGTAYYYCVIIIMIIIMIWLVVVVVAAAVVVVVVVVVAAVALPGAGPGQAAHAPLASRRGIGSSL